MKNETKVKIKNKFGLHYFRFFKGMELHNVFRNPIFAVFVYNQVISILDRSYYIKIPFTWYVLGGLFVFIGYIWLIYITGKIYDKLNLEPYIRSVFYARSGQLIKDIKTLGQNKNELNLGRKDGTKKRE